MKKILTFTLALVGCVAILTGCKDKTSKPVTQGPVTQSPTTTQEQLKYYNFVIYEKDSDREDLTNNTVVATYKIGYYASTSKFVTETLIKNDGKYYFTQGGSDYITISDSGMIMTGYFKDYSECAGNTAIDISWSYCAVNGASATKGINETSLTSLTEYGLVINGWA